MVRKLKVYETSGYNYKGTSTIILKGKWLKECGFKAGDDIEVECQDGKLIVKRRQRMYN